MKNRLRTLFVLSIIATLGVACSDAVGDKPIEDGASVEDGTTATSSTRAASLEGALPADGQIVQGEFMLAAVVDGEDAVEVRFFVDGAELAVVNEMPYQARIDGCELSAGNHAYVVEIRDDEGQRDHMEQWFEVEPCN